MNVTILPDEDCFAFDHIEFEVSVGHEGNEVYWSNGTCGSRTQTRNPRAFGIVFYLLNIPKFQV